MRRWLFSIAVLLGLWALSACAAREAAPAPAGPAPEAILPRKDAWQEEWERVLEAAKREGRVAVAGPPGTDPRRALTEGFERRYGIAVDYLGAAGAEKVTRLRTEREAGQHLWDIMIDGTTSYFALKPISPFEPIEPTLILPEVKELKNWREGKLEFGEKERLSLVFSLFQRGILFVNPNLVKVEEFKSYKDLLDPKWKGKILMQDPRVPGPGRAAFIFLYKHPELGPDFIRALARQEPTITRDYRQQAEWVGQGRFPALIGTADQTVEELAKQGLPIAIVPATQVREGTDVSPANGVVALFKNAPHPNAARVYINWLLSKEGQTEHARAFGYVSRRGDVPTDHVPAWRVPREGAIDSYKEETQELHDKTVLPFLREVFGR